MINSQLMNSENLNLEFKNESHHKFKSLINWLNPNFKRHNYKYLDYEKILTMLNDCESAVEKSQKMLYTNQMEMNNYLKLYQKIEIGIQKAEDNFKTCKENLKKKDFDNQESNYKLETMRNLFKLEVELGNLNIIKEDLSKKLDKRQKQFENLLSTAQNLQILFSKEEHMIANAINYHLKQKQRKLLKQQSLEKIKQDFNNVLTLNNKVKYNCLNEQTKFLFKQDQNSFTLEKKENFKMPKIILKQILKDSDKKNKEINIKLNKLHFINNDTLETIDSKPIIIKPIVSKPIITKPIITNHKVFETNHFNSLVSCR